MIAIGIVVTGIMVMVGYLRNDRIPAIMVAISSTWVVVTLIIGEPIIALVYFLMVIIFLILLRLGRPH